jgi:sulfate permease, SulP family
MNPPQSGTALALAFVSGTVKTISSAAVVGSMSVILVVSYASIIYTGPIAPFRSQGIGLMLMGAIIMALIGPTVLSYRGSLIQPQDISTILLSISAASIAAMPGIRPDSAFSTVVMLVVITSLAMGASVYLMGRLHFGHLVRFIPFPVVGGFMAASGVLLVRSAMEMVMPASGSVANFVAKWPLWLPWLAASFGILAVSRSSWGSFGMPLSLSVILCGFFAVSSVFGLDAAALAQRGLLLGPFQGQSFASGISPSLLTDVQWWVLLSQLPLIAAVVGVSVLGTLLNASALELSIGQELDFERELKGVGFANCAAGLVGGTPGYHSLSKTTLARRFGVVGIGAGLGVAATLGVALFVGGGILGNLPIGLVAALVWYLGFDLLLKAIRDHGRQMPRSELGIVLVMPIIALVFGFMAAVGFGIAVAVLLFVVTYSRVDSTRLSTSAANFHARIERHPNDIARLTDLGASVRIDRLAGFLFFGSASMLVDRIQKQLLGSPIQRYAIIDLERVVGLDTSAWAAFERLGRTCQKHGMEMIITGLSPQLAARFGGNNTKKQGHFRIADTLDNVLAKIEDDLLAQSSQASPSADDHDTEADLAHVLRQVGHQMQLSAGDELLAQGSHCDHLVVLLRGRLRATVTDADESRRIVNRFLPGAIVGEIAFYTGAERTASISAETDATVLRIDVIDVTTMERDDPATAMQFHRTLARLLARRLTTARQLLDDAEI